MSLSRALSMIVVVLYAAGSYTAGMGALGLLQTLAFCVLPCACIWFPEALGDYVGGILTGFTRESPAPIVWLLGWVLLLVPVLGFALARFEAIGMR